MKESVLQMSQIELEISNPCNEKCVHCYRHCLNTHKGFLSVEQAKSALEQAKNLGTKSVTITGGEALLNPNWKEIIKIADELEFRVSLLTNGTLLKEEDADFLLTVKNLKEVIDLFLVISMLTPLFPSGHYYALQKCGAI